VNDCEAGNAPAAGAAGVSASPGTRASEKEWDCIDKGLPRLPSGVPSSSNSKAMLTPPRGVEHAVTLSAERDRIIPSEPDRDRPDPARDRARGEASSVSTATRKPRDRTRGIAGLGASGPGGSP